MEDHMLDQFNKDLEKLPPNTPPIPLIFNSNDHVKNIEI